MNERDNLSKKKKIHPTSPDKDGRRIDDMRGAGGELGGHCR